MTSSGTYSYSLTNGEAVLAAFERCQLRLPEMRQEHFATARREVNLLLAEWANRQVNLWKVELDTQTLTQGSATYPLAAKVVMILDAYRSINTGTTNQSNIYMTPISRTEYASYAAPQTQGPPTVYWFDRTITPTVTFFPTPDGNGPYVFNYYAVVQIQDANIASGETPDIPYRWYDAFAAGLAYRLARTYPPPGVDPVAFLGLRKAEYDEAWRYASTQDTENVNMSLVPSLSAYYRRG